MPFGPHSSDAEVAAAYRGQSVLVTGGGGGRGCAGGAPPPPPARWNLPASGRLTFLEGSILDRELLGRAFAKKPSTVFHLAAFFANQNSVDPPETDLNGD